MASTLRPTLLKQTCLSAASKRAFSSFSNLPAINKPTVSGLARKTIRSTFAKDAVRGPMQVASFHASGQQLILPPLPQTINGTANDAAEVPDPNPSHGSYHWTFERLISASLVPLTIAPFAAGSLNPIMDAVLCGTIIIHSHIGFESCIIDYFPTKRVPKTRMFCWWLLRGCTVAVGVGLYEFETNDVGVTEAIKRIWKA